MKKRESPDFRSPEVGISVTATPHPKRIGRGLGTRQKRSHGSLRDVSRFRHLRHLETRQPVCTVDNTRIFKEVTDVKL